MGRRARKHPKPTSGPAGSRRVQPENRIVAAKGETLNLSAYVSFGSCIISIVFGVISVGQASRRDALETRAAQAAARSVAVTRQADFGAVHEYVLRTQLMFASAQHKASFAESVTSGVFAEALSTDQSPSMNMSLDEMHVLGKVNPDAETATAQCKNELLSMNQTKNFVMAKVSRGPTEDDPDNSQAQVYMGLEIEALPRVDAACRQASIALHEIASPGEPLDGAQFDAVEARLLALMVQDQKYRLLDRPNGKYQFGPTLEKLSRGERVALPQP